MRVTPDAQLFTALSRDLGARDAALRRREGNSASGLRDSFIADAYGKRAEPVRKAAAMTLAKDRSTERDSENRTDQSVGRREAPRGMRPQYMPKGQAVDLLV